MAVVHAVGDRVARLLCCKSPWIEINVLFSFILISFQLCRFIIV